ncbi:MAG: hypothetical protein GX456_12220 [Verrucomicrobia bacterium]|nr:hypothetical protein [Verrucomicrobiota bacterium]
MLLVPVQEIENLKWGRYPVTSYDPDSPINGTKTSLSGLWNPAYLR